MSKSQHIVFSAAAAFTMLSGCVINPVTGDRELAFVSADQEIAIGEQQYAPSQQMQGGEYALDPELTSYVAGVGQKLAAVSDRQLPYEFVVLNSSVPNAWALPGGKIAVNRGLLTELSTEAELAAVLGSRDRARGRATRRARNAARAAAARRAARDSGRRATRRVRRAHRRRREPRRAVADDAQRPRGRARIGSVRHALHADSGLRPERRRHAAGDVRAALGAERRRRRPARSAVREPPAVGRARAEESRDGSDARRGRRSRPRALSSRDGAAAAARNRRTTPTTKDARR